jgi:hypothetical protein
MLGEELTKPTKPCQPDVLSVLSASLIGAFGKGADHDGS